MIEQSGSGEGRRVRQHVLEINTHCVRDRFVRASTVAEAKELRRGDVGLKWIVYSGDHGEMLGDHGLMAEMNFYRSSVRVPLIVRPPGGTTGRVESAPVHALDVAATLLDVGSAEGLAGAPSRSLVPFVTGDGGRPREHLVSMIRLRPGTPTWQAITDGTWRATINADTGEASELFDLDADPGEATNLVGDEAAVDALDQLTTAVGAIVGTS